MAKVIVTFEDETSAVVTGFYSSPQDPDLYQNLGEVEEGDQRFLDFLARQNPPIDSSAVAAAERDRLLGMAAIRMGPLQDAVDLDDATAADVALLKQWKQYRVAVNRIDLAQASQAWPALP